MILCCWHHSRHLEKWFQGWKALGFDFGVWYFVRPGSFKRKKSNGQLINNLKEAEGQLLSRLQKISPEPFERGKIWRKFMGQNDLLYQCCCCCFVASLCCDEDFTGLFRQRNSTDSLLLLRWCCHAMHV